MINKIYLKFNYISVVLFFDFLNKSFIMTKELVNSLYL